MIIDGPATSPEGEKSTLIVDDTGICLRQQDAETPEGLGLEALVSEGFLWWPQAPLPLV